MKKQRFWASIGFWAVWLSLAGPRLLATDALRPGSLQSLEKHNSFSTDSLKTLWKRYKVPRAVVPVQNGVEIYELIYITQWVDGTPIRASGLLFVPVGARKPAAWMIYDHGTQLQIRRDNLGGEQFLCMGFAANGYAVVMPDYVGLGKGERRHLYLHAESEALAGIHMLEAAQSWAQTSGLKTSGQLFVTGYSQGGHASMATHKLLEERYAGKHKLTASSPMSGGYDLTGVQSDVMFKPYENPGYLPYLMFSYNLAYSMYDDLWAVFRTPLDSLLPIYLDGTHSFDTLNRILPTVPADMVKPELVKAYREDPEFAFRKHLKANSLTDWKPQAPLQLCYCNADEQVSYLNSVRAWERMRELGAQRVVLRRSARKLRHSDCALYAAIHTKMWFDSFRRGSRRGNKGPLFKRLLLGLSKL